MERLAIALNKRIWGLWNSALLMLLAGLWFVEAGTEEQGNWGFVMVALGVLFGGLAIFSELFAPKEEVLESGEYVRISKVSSAGPLPKLVALILFGVWFAGWCVVMTILACKITGNA